MLDKSRQNVTPQTYQAAVERLAAARDSAQQGKDVAEKFGDVAAVERNLESLRAAVDEFKGMRSRMSKKEIFAAEFSVEVVSPHEVSLVIPRGVSRLDLLHRAQDLSREMYGQNAVADFQLASCYPKERVFYEAMSNPYRLRIDGCVRGTVGKDFPVKIQVLSALGLEEAPAEDAIVAHAAFYVVTGDDLFTNREVRARSAILSFFKNEGLLKYDTSAIRDISTQPRAMGIAARRKSI